MKFEIGKNKKDFMRYTIVALCLVLLCVLSISDGSEMLMFAFILGVFACVKISFKKKITLVSDLIVLFYACLVGVYIDHSICTYDMDFLVNAYGGKYVSLFIMQVTGFSSIVIEMFVIAFIYCVCRAFGIGSKISAIIAPIPTMALCIVDYYEFKFKGTELLPGELKSAETAFNVIGGYHFDLRTIIIVAVIPFVIYVISLYVNADNKGVYINKKIHCLVCIVMCIVLSLACYFTLNHIKTYKKTLTWGNQPSAYNGFITNFAMSVLDLNISAPQGYNRDDYSNLNNSDVRYEADTNIIIVMNESFADYSIFNDQLQLNEDVIPYFHSLSGNNIVSGTAYSSVYGGTTANSEYELLTGLSTCGLPNGAVPYTMYIDSEMNTLPQFLSELGYSTTVMHPYLSTGFNRPNVYPLLGFENIMFIDDFEYTESDLVRQLDLMYGKSGLMSDECAYRNLLDMIDENEEGTLNFYYLITIQNHGGYSEENERLEVQHYISDSIEDDNQTNTYLSNVNRSDTALKYLLDELAQKDERYLVLFFGDHQPSLFSVNSTPNGFDAGGKLWQVPYLIWANYELPEELQNRNLDTSINYLALDVLTAAGIPYSSYFSSINEIRKNIPMIHSNGYYSAESNSWESVDNQVIQENYWMNKYLSMEYYYLFDK
ncbi:MAG: LTA synthase family protein [Saccharofermentans sp.]|nr:LTA synthase family protein [Saccharofermentans sp.]